MSEQRHIVRAVNRSHVEFRERGDDLPGDVLGVLDVRFARFNTWNPIDDWFEGTFVERVAPGAFRKTFGERADQIKVLFNHGHDAAGRVALGHVVELAEDADGPRGTVWLHDNSVTRDLLPGLRRGVYGASYMFEVISEQRDEAPAPSKDNPTGLPERTIREVKLFEFGPVTFPADEGTSVGMRSMTSLFLPPHVLATRHGGPAPTATEPPDGHSAGTDTAEPPDGHSSSRFNPELFDRLEANILRRLDLAHP